MKSFDELFMLSADELVADLTLEEAKDSLVQLHNAGDPCTRWVIRAVRIARLNTRLDLPDGGKISGQGT